VPPIFQPEVAAEAITWAAEHGGRELFVGLPAVRTIIGNKLAPGFADRYLAAHGYDTQQTDEPEDPNRPDNLWQPVDDTADHGAHGRFDATARTNSWVKPFVRHPRLTGSIAGALVATGAVLGWQWTRE
jgi:hypothetical protein